MGHPLLETRNIDIRNSVFNQTSALYIRCNKGIGQQQALLTVVPDPIQLVPVINDIRIESSTFYFLN
jgi:hypothetical protein